MALFRASTTRPGEFEYALSDVALSLAFCTRSRTVLHRTGSAAAAWGCALDGRAIVRVTARQPSSV